MNANGRPVSEDDLHAYVDGFLAPEDRARVERYIGTYPEAAARVRDWERNRTTLRRALDFKASEPIPSSLNLARLSAARSRQRSWDVPRMAASIVVALVIGSGAGWWARGGTAVQHGLAGLSQQAALTERVFSTDAHLIRFSENTEHQLGFAGQDLSRKVKAPDLSASGYKLLGGRLVPTEQGSACMFVYTNASGARISIFTRLMVGTDTNAAMRPVEAKGVNGYAWSHDGIGYSLISTKPDPSLRELSNQVRSETGART